MTDATLGGRVFEPPSPRPPWLRPAVIAIVVALHAAALSILTFAPRPLESPREVIVDIEPEAPPAQAPTPPADAPRPPEKSAAESAPAPPQDAAPVVEQPPLPSPEPSPPPVVEQPPLPPPEAPPPVAGQPPPQPEPTPPAATATPEEQPPLPQPEPAPPPAAVELAPPAPSLPRTVQTPPKPPPPARSDAPRLQPRPEPRAAPAQAQSRPATAQGSRGAPSADAPSSASAGAVSQSAYIGEVSAAIRSRMFYPPAARARGAKGVVGVAFTIGASGALTSFAITRSSGDADLDAAARALVQSARFPPPPGGSVHIATSFNYVPR